jgi:hypothetical protein
MKNFKNTGVRKMKNLIKLNILILLLAGSTSHAGQLKPETIEERAAGSQKVIHAKVVGVQSYKTTNSYGDQLIMSRLKLNVLETLKGADHHETEMVMEGGTVDGLTMKNSSLPAVSDLQGSELVLFLVDSKEGLAPYHAGIGIVPLDSVTKKVPKTNLDLETIRKKVKGTP